MCCLWLGSYFSQREITCISPYLCWCVYTMLLSSAWVVLLAATGCHGERCINPDSEEIKAEVFRDILVHFGMLHFSLGSKFMGKPKQIITGSPSFNFRRQRNGGVIPDSKQAIPSAAITDMSGIL